MIVIESTGRKLKDAIDNGLKQLNKTLMDVDVEVLDNGGLFRKAKVRITVKGDDEQESTTPVEERKEPVKAERKGEETINEQHNREFKRERKFPEERRNEFADRKRPRSEVREEKSDNDDAAKEEGREMRHAAPITQEAAETAEKLAREIVAKMGIDTLVTSSIVNGGVVIDFEAHNSELIGYHGEVLDAIEYLISCAINKEEDKFYRVVVDCDNYRAKRRDNLVALANKMAAKCVKVRHKIVLEPMNSNERRIIHATLANNDKIITKSEGREPNRRVVIFCKRR